MKQKKMDVNEQSKIEQRRLENLEQFWEQVRPGVVFDIYRVEPVWCAGFLESHEIDPESPIDIDYILRKWGGRKLRFRLRGENGQYIKQVDFKARSYQPLFRGHVITESDYEEIPYVKKKEDPPTQIQQSTPTPVQQQSPDLKGLLDMVKKLQNDNLEMMKTMMKQQINQAVQTPVSGSGIKDIITFMKQYRDLRDLIGDGEVPERSEPNLLGTITEIARALGNQTKPLPAANVINPSGPKVNSENQLSETNDAKSFKDLVLYRLLMLPENVRLEAVKGVLDGLGVNLNEQDFCDEDDEEEDDNTSPETPEIPS